RRSEGWRPLPILSRARRLEHSLLVKRRPAPDDRGHAPVPRVDLGHMRFGRRDVGKHAARQLRDVGRHMRETEAARHCPAIEDARAAQLQWNQAPFFAQVRMFLTLLAMASAVELEFPSIVSVVPVAGFVFGLANTFMLLAPLLIRISTCGAAQNGSM